MLHIETKLTKDTEDYLRDGRYCVHDVHEPYQCDDGNDGKTCSGSELKYV